MVRAVDHQRRFVFVLDPGDQLCDPVRRVVQPGLEGSQVVLLHAAHHGAHGVGHPGAGVDLPVPVLPDLALGRVEQVVQRFRHVHALRVDLQRVGGQRVPLHPLDVFVHAVGNAQDQRDPDDADGPGEGRQQRPPLLRQQVGQAQVQRREDAHGALLFALFGAGGRGPLRRGLPHDPAVAGHLPVQHPDDPVRVFIGQVRVVRHHDDQAFPADLPQDLHDLYARFAVQRAGRLVRQQDLRIVDQGPRDGHALHLAAAQLVGLLAQLVGQPDLFQRFLRPAAAFLPADAAQRQRQLHVGQHRLVRNQVVALEHEPDRVVPVGVPVAFLKLLRALPADDQVALRVLVQSADNIQQRGLPAPRRSEDRDEFAA